MYVRFVGVFLLSFVSLGLSFVRPSFALPIVYTSMMTPQDEAMSGLRDLVTVLGNGGLRTVDFEALLPQIVLHEEGAQSAGVLLEDADNGQTFTATRSRYNGFTVVITDKKIHIILKPATITALVTRAFVFANQGETPLAGMIHQLLRLFFFRSRCFEGSVQKEDDLASALTQHTITRVAISSLLQTQQFEEGKRLQADLTAMVSEALREIPRWEPCYAALGHLFVAVDFDSLPSGEPLFEGAVIEGQYLEKGALFRIANTALPPDQLLIENASGEVTLFFQGMTLPNVLTNRGFSPGSAGSLGCESDMSIEFVDPATQQSTTRSSVSLRWIAGIIPPVHSPLPVGIVAKDRAGRIIASDEFQLWEPFFAPASFTLSVTSGRRRIASIETQGITGNGICAAFDNLAFWPPVQ